jgi:hypothetical protein
VVSVVHKKYLVLAKAVQGLCMAIVPAVMAKASVAVKGIVAAKVSMNSI